jgi:hypothetical protein
MNQLSCSAFSGGLAPQPEQKPLKKDCERNEAPKTRPIMLFDVC